MGERGLATDCTSIKGQRSFFFHDSDSTNLDKRLVNILSKSGL